MLDKTNPLIIRDNAGAAAIEYAIILPVLVLISLWLFEAGIYFVKDEIVNSTINNIQQTLQRDPSYYDSLSTTQINALLAGYGSGIVKFTPIGSAGTNNICVDTYSTAAKAENASPCKDTHFITAIPNGLAPQSPYYVAVRSNLTKGTVTPLENFAKPMQNAQVQQTSGVVYVANNMVPPTCQGDGNILQYDSANKIFKCVNLNPPDCAQPWNKYQFNAISGQFECVNIPYVIAGGIAQPSTSNGGVWVGDVDFWYGVHTHYNFTICQRNVTFTIPTGLPPGKLLAQGSLIYPGAPGWWHAWTVSFFNLNMPFAGGPASLDVCIDNGGNFVDGTWQPGIGAEHASWTVTFVPN